MPVYRVTVNGTTYEVAIEDPFASPVVATVDGQPYTVELAPLAPAAAEPDLPPAVTPAAAALPVPAREPTPPAVQDVPARPPAPAASAAGEPVLAPMPGKVLSVAVKVGDSVGREDEVLTLEAMKMAMTVRAPVAGVVRQVNVAPGQSVRNGETLLVIG